MVMERRFSNLEDWGGFSCCNIYKDFFSLIIEKVLHNLMENEWNFHRNLMRLLKQLFNFDWNAGNLITELIDLELRI